MSVRPASQAPCGAQFARPVLVVPPVSLGAGRHAQGSGFEKEPTGPAVVTIRRPRPIARRTRLIARLALSCLVVGIRHDGARLRAHARGAKEEAPQGTGDAEVGPLRTRLTAWRARFARLESRIVVVARRADDTAGPIWERCVRDAAFLAGDRVNAQLAAEKTRGTLRWLSVAVKIVSLFGGAIPGTTNTQEIRARIALAADAGAGADGTIAGARLAFAGTRVRVGFIGAIERQETRRNRDIKVIPHHAFQAVNW